MWLSPKHWGYQNCDSSPLHCFVFKDTAAENPWKSNGQSLGLTIIFPVIFPRSSLDGKFLHSPKCQIPQRTRPQSCCENRPLAPSIRSSPRISSRQRSGETWRVCRWFPHQFPGCLKWKWFWVPPMEQSWNGHVWEVNHLGIRNVPWLWWIPRGFRQNGTVKSCKNYPFWVLNMTRHCGFLGLKYGQVLWWPTPTWKQSCVEPSSCGSGAMKFIKFTALMPPEIFGKCCNCHFCMAGRHIGDICWYLVLHIYFHDPFRPFCWGLSHWGVEKLERWRWKERIMRCRVSRDGTCLMSWILLIE